jgi:nicotinate-nucleotide adenylyltransferase
MPRRIGLLGGTFDPIHLGHLAMAEWTRDELDLEQIIFIPNRTPPHKTTAPISSPEHRLAMVEGAIAGNPYFAVSTIELAREGPSYTIDTLRALRQNADFAGADLFWIIGADSLASFHEWREPREIQRLCVLVAYPRSGVRLEKASDEVVSRAIILDAPLLELASSSIRLRHEAGHSIRYLVPDAVADYIERVGLYQKN